MGMTSIGPPRAAHRSIDQIDSCPERGVYIQIRGVEQGRVFRLAQRGRASRAVSLVPGADIGENFGLGNRDSDALRSSKKRRKARISGLAVTKSFTSAFGTNDRADVAAIEHRAGARMREDSR